MATPLQHTFHRLYIDANNILITVVMNRFGVNEQVCSRMQFCRSFTTSIFFSCESDGFTFITGPSKIPSGWKSVLQDPSTLQIFFDYYAITKPPLSKEALGCLVRLALVRRSLFSNNAACSKFLAHLMTESKEILQAGQGIALQTRFDVKISVAVAEETRLTFVTAENKFEAPVSKFSKQNLSE